MHSTYSDGQFSPEELVKMANEKNVRIMAITDHNGVNGVEKALKAGRTHGVEVIPAIELYTTFKNKSLHLLGYGIDIKNKTLNQTLKKLKAQRIEKVKSTVKKLQKIGFIISENDLLKIPTDYISAGHVIFLLSKNARNRQKIINDLKTKNITLPQIVTSYLIKGKPAHLPEESLPMQKAIQFIKSAGGMPVLAHPGQHLTWAEDNIIYELKNLGVKGLEAISTHHTWHQIEHYQLLAKNLGLFITGGSDFHGELKTVDNYFINNCLDYFKVPYFIYLNIKKYLK